MVWEAGGGGGEGKCWGRQVAVLEQILHRYWMHHLI